MHLYIYCYGLGIVVDVVDVIVNKTKKILWITCLGFIKKHGQINK